MIKQLTKADFLEKIYDFEGTNAPQNCNTASVVVFFHKNDPKNLPIYLELLGNLQLKFPDVAFYRANVMEEQLLAGDLGIRRVPAILFVPLHKRPRIAHGVFSETDFEQAIQKIFKINTSLKSKIEQSIANRL
ncbi:MAG: hypothetical protein LBH92_02450 [Bacteroidales bacterium]|jgi:hypothetical protein|nr:hypothetical protein [Bacteroidales bacterium]